MSLESNADRAIGPYRLLSRLREGNAGVVYLAEHVDTRRRVLVMDAERRMMMDSFREKVSALRKEPDRAQVLDEGASEDGVPWCAMEFSDDVPLDELFFCDNAPANTLDGHFAEIRDGHPDPQLMPSPNAATQPWMQENAAVNTQIETLDGAGPHVTADGRARTMTAGQWPERNAGPAEAAWARYILRVTPSWDARWRSS